MKKEKNKAREQMLESSAFLPLLPLKNVAMLPKSIIPVIVGRDISIKAVEHALKTNRMLFISAQKHAATETPAQDDVFIHGTRSTILQVMRMPNGPLKILAEGLCRAKAIGFENHEDGFINVQYEDLPKYRAFYRT
jgi:ATP-dependent Lon protease